jgi:hypothetical protein
MLHLSLWPSQPAYGRFLALDESTVTHVLTRVQEIFQRHARPQEAAAIMTATLPPQPPRPCTDARSARPPQWAPIAVSPLHGRTAAVGAMGARRVRCRSRDRSDARTRLTYRFRRALGEPNAPYRATGPERALPLAPGMTGFS